MALSQDGDYLRGDHHGVLHGGSDGVLGRIAQGHAQLIPMDSGPALLNQSAQPLLRGGGKASARGVGLLIATLIDNPDTHKTYTTTNKPIGHRMS